MEHISVMYISVAAGIAIGIAIAGIAGAAARNWDGHDSARDLIADYLRRHPGSSRELIADGTCLTNDTVRQELEHMHRDGQVFVTTGAQGRWVVPVYYVVQS